MIPQLSVNYFLPFLKSLALGGCIALAGCATSNHSDSLPELPKTVGRVIIEGADRSPFSFNDRLFGRIILIEDTNNNEIFSDIDSPIQLSTTWLDLAPGTYKLRAQCENFPAFRGARTVWMVSETIQINAAQTNVLGCEYFKRKDRNDKSSKNRRSFGVHLVQR